MERRRHDGGFTLIEVLVALILLGLLSILLFNGIRTGARGLEAVSARSSAVEEVAVVQGFLRRRLVQARREHGSVAGGRTGLRVVAPWLDVLADGGDRVFTLAFERGADGLALVLRWQDAGPGPDTSGSSHPGSRVLLQPLIGGHFAYFGSTHVEAPPIWRHDWPADAPLPRLVRLEIAFADPGRAWPRFVVALR